MFINRAIISPNFPFSLEKKNTKKHCDKKPDFLEKDFESLKRRNSFSIDSVKKYVPQTVVLL